MKDELGDKIFREFGALWPKTYNYWTNDSDVMKIKKTKGTKKCVVKRKLKFEDYKHCSEATQLENKINRLEKNKLDVNGLWKYHRKFIKNNKLMLIS